MICIRNNYEKLRKYLLPKRNCFNAKTKKEVFGKNVKKRLHNVGKI